MINLLISLLKLGYYLILLFLLFIPLLCLLYLLPSGLIMQTIYIKLKSLRDKKYLNAIIGLTLAVILLVAIYLTINILHSNLTYNWGGGNILGSLFVIELQFLPLFVFLYAILDYCVYLIVNKIGAWFDNKNVRYEFINIFIKSGIGFILILKSTSYLTKLLNTRKKVVNKIQQGQNSNVLLDKFTALNKDKLNQHTLLVGTTGSGKTTTLL